MSRTSRLGIILGVTLGVAVVAPAAAAAPLESPQANGRAYCSPSGDLCYAALDKGAKVRLRITLMARYFSRYRLCVRAPSGRRDCRRFRVRPIERGLYQSTVRWAERFPYRGQGTYRARWSYAGGVLGPAIRFEQGPSIRTSRARISAGATLRVFGLAGGCAEGNRVTLMSEAFPPEDEFAGIPAVFARVDSHDSYSVRVAIPETTEPGGYSISARCGGSGFGLRRSFTVVPPATS